MIEMSMDEWGKRLLQTRRYKTIQYNYAEKCTIVRDMLTGNRYEATYNMTTHMMNLKRLKNDGSS